MSLLRRLWFRLLERALMGAFAETRRYGRLTLSETDMEGGIGWTAALRPLYVPGTHAPRYQWMGQGPTIGSAVREALERAKEAPVMERIVGTTFAPKLGSKEFDE